MVDDAGILLPQRILNVYDGLSRAERRLADMLLENIDLVGLHAASALAERAGVSKATTARFFRRLGYPSFKAAQRQARLGEEGWLGAPSPQAPRPSGAAQVELSRHLTAEVQNLVRTIETLRSDELAAAITNLARADKLWVVGFGDNYPLAHFARALLIRVKADIRMIPIGGFSIPEEFASISPNDAMLALGLGRKTRSLRSIMRSAIRAGAQVVFVTDQVTRAGPDVATVTLRCRTQGLAVFDSVVAPVSLLTHLCASLALRIGQGAFDRLRAIETIHEEWGDLLPGDI
jgi:DNA-binding MurR/RpiR family transcriptional regulator